MGTVAIMTPHNQVHMSGDSVNTFHAILRMLKSIPEVHQMFISKSFRKGCKSKMPIFEEIGVLFETKNVDLSAFAYLRFLISSENSEKQDFAKNFKIIYEAVQRELSFSNEESINVWEKFKRSYSKNCGNCERLSLAGSPEILEVTPLDCSRTTVTRLINSFKLDPEDNQDNECLLCHAVQDDATAVVDDNTWMRWDGAKHTPASKDGVKNVNNKLFMYVKLDIPSTKYKCQLVGCPFDRELESWRELSRHIKREHPRCRHCKKIFLVSCLYREHLLGSDTCQFSSIRKEAIEVPSKKEDNEIIEDSGLESMSDSAGEEPVTVTKRNPNFRKSIKRKAEGEEQIDQNSKRQKIDSAENSNISKMPHCISCRCPTNEQHWCQCPPIQRDGHLLRTRGTLLREKSFVNGVQTFVPFNNSFLEPLGCQFYFKNKEGVIEINSYSQEGQEYDYQLTLSSKNSNKTSPVRARIGERRRVAAFELDKYSVQYELVVNSKL